MWLVLVMEHFTHDASQPSEYNIQRLMLWIRLTIARDCSLPHFRTHSFRFTTATRAVNTGELSLMTFLSTG